MRIATRIPQSCFSSLLMALILAVVVQPCAAQKRETETTADGGTLEKYKDKDGHVVRERWYKDGHLSLAKDYDAKDGHIVETRYYDKDGIMDKKVVINPTLAGGRIEKIYDAYGHWVESKQYDKAGKLIYEEAPTPAGSMQIDFTDEGFFQKKSATTTGRVIY